MALPLVFVVILSMIKHAFEDYKRHKSDEKENRSKALVYSIRDNKFERLEWKEIQVGHIVKICENEMFPGDMLLLQGSDAVGTCYVETKNLDGETNLKSKYVLKELQKVFLD